MARKRELKFFECRDCENVTLLGTTSESTCPGCGAANGRVISSSDLARRIEEGVVCAGPRKLKLSKMFAQKGACAAKGSSP
jgi:hypothetical protein